MIMTILNKSDLLKSVRSEISLRTAILWLFLFLSSCGLEVSAPFKPDFDVQPWNPISGGRMNAAAGAINGKLYIVGGYIYTGEVQCFNSLWIYDPTDESWTAGADMPTSRASVFLRYGD